MKCCQCEKIFKNVTTKKIRWWAACLRITIFIANSFIWIAAIFALVCGLMVGFSNGTFSLDAEESDIYDGGEIRWRDLGFTTPATLLVYYGIFLLVTAIVGCFVGSHGEIYSTVIFIVCIVIVLLFDLIMSFIFFWNPYAMNNFIDHLNKSMDNYGVDGTPYVGVFSKSSTVYWDHLQIIGSCCGIFKNSEWSRKKIGSKARDYSLPDSCCTNDYDYKKCGWRVWKHMEQDMEHFRSQMLKKVGCMSIFPEELTVKYHEIAYIVIFLGILLLVSVILSVLLIVLMGTKRYRIKQGPIKRPAFATDPPIGSALVNYSINEERGGESFIRKNRRLSSYDPQTKRRSLGRRGSSNAKVIPFSVKRGSGEVVMDNNSARDLFVNKEFGGGNSTLAQMPISYKAEEGRVREIKEDVRERPVSS